MYFPTTPISTVHSASYYTKKVSKLGLAAIHVPNFHVLMYRLRFELFAEQREGLPVSRGVFAMNNVPRDQSVACVTELSA